MSDRTTVRVTPRLVLGREVPLLLPFARPIGLPDELRPQMCISCHRRSGIARDTPLRSVVCGPCWFASGGESDPSELDARPHAPSTELPHSAEQWLHTVRASSWFRSRRGDCARRLEALLVTLARHADWDDHTTWPTWERLMERTGWGRSTMSGWLAELQRLGFLLRVERGTTPRFRPMALAHLEGNRAAVYQLRLPCPAPATPLPPPDDHAGSIRTPTHSRKNHLSSDPVVPARANTLINSCDRTFHIDAPTDGPHGPRLDHEPARFFDLRVPVTPAQMLAAASELRQADRALWRLSPRWLRALFRPWWRAGWTNRDLLHALSHAPAVGGTRPVDRCPAEQLRRPDGWVRHRMSRWRTATGPAPAPRVWDHARRRVEREHGAAAAGRLPYGAVRLEPEDLAARPHERDEAAAQLVRQWAREMHERRNAPTPDDQIPDEATRRRRWQEVCDHIGRRSPAGRTEDTASTPSLPAPEDAPSVWERALDRARREGRAPLLRRRRRRAGW